MATDDRAPGRSAGPDAGARNAKGRFPVALQAKAAARWSALSKAEPGHC
jgi:hypothetical protein